MTGSTHAASGMLAAETVLLTGKAPLEYWPAGLLFGAIAGLLADLDHESSTVTTTLPFAGILARFFPHRTVTHGLFGIIAFAFLLRFAFPWMSRILFVSIVAGYISHPVVDMANVMGVAWLAPLPISNPVNPTKNIAGFWAIKWPLFRITTASDAETKFFRPLVWAVLGLLTVSQFKGHTTYATIVPVLLSSACVAMVALVISEKRYVNFFHGVILLAAGAILFGWLWHIPAVRQWFMGAYGQTFRFIAQYKSIINPVIGPIFALYGKVAH
ncbi:inner membrane protein [Peptococcaceae bacterium CEB3]|nr:inner membrane protein [Peptococcaceae bacterium CEB3]